MQIVGNCFAQSYVFLGGPKAIVRAMGAMTADSIIQLPFIDTSAPLNTISGVNTRAGRIAINKLDSQLVVLRAGHWVESGGSGCTLANDQIGFGSSNLLSGKSYFNYNPTGKYEMQFGGGFHGFAAYSDTINYLDIYTGDYSPIKFRGFQSELYEDANVINYSLFTNASNFFNLYGDMRFGRKSADYFIGNVNQESTFGRYGQIQFSEHNNPKSDIQIGWLAGYENQTELDVSDSTKSIKIHADSILANCKISKVTDPTLPQDAATKNYVDNLVPITSPRGTLSVSGSSADVDTAHSFTWTAASGNQFTQQVSFGNAGAQAGKQIFYNDSDNATFTIVAPRVPTTWSWTPPLDKGTNHYAMMSDGNGKSAWNSVTTYIQQTGVTGDVRGKTLTIPSGYTKVCGASIHNTSATPGNAEHPFITDATISSTTLTWYGYSAEGSATWSDTYTITFSIAP